MTATLQKFLGRCAEGLIAGATTETVAAGATRFADAVATAQPFDGPPSWLPVLNTLDALPDNDLSRQLVALAPGLRWTPTFRRDEDGNLDGGNDIALCLLATVFTDNALTTEATSDVGITAGLSYLGPHRRYPLHHHAPQEIYLVIAGTAQWRYGGAEKYVPVVPGQVIYNHPNDPHSMITEAEALLALWVLF